MSKFDGVLLASDFDDTIYNSAMEVSKENCDAINYFIQNGGCFSVATGRSYQAFVKQAESIPMNAPAVLSNGCAIYDFKKKEYLAQTYLCKSVLEDCREIIRAVPEIGFEVYHDEEIFAHNPNHITRLHMKRVGAKCISCPLEQIPQPWTKVIFEQDAAVLNRVESYFKTHWPERYEIIYSNRYLLELTDKNSNKGWMVLRISQLLQISRSHIYCVGDNKNDIPMLEIAAIPFAPANAAAEVKEMGARVVGSCDEHCLRDIIEILDEIY